MGTEAIGSSPFPLTSGGDLPLRSDWIEPREEALLMMINKIASKVNPEQAQRFGWVAQGLPPSGFVRAAPKALMGGTQWVNPTLKTATSRISIEIRPKIIYVDTVRFVFLIFNIP